MNNLLSVIRRHVFVTLPLMFAVTLTVFCIGCDDRPEVYASRFDDPEYRAQEKKMFEVQQQIAKARAANKAAMSRMIAEKRRELTEGAKLQDAEIMKALENDKDRSAAWKKLVQNDAEYTAGLEKHRQLSMQTIRNRMRQELDDRAAVQKGTAKLKQVEKKPAK